MDPTAKRLVDVVRQLEDRAARWFPDAAVRVAMRPDPDASTTTTHRLVVDVTPQRRYDAGELGRARLNLGRDVSHVLKRHSVYDLVGFDFRLRPPAPRVRKPSDRTDDGPS